MARDRDGCSVACLGDLYAKIVAKITVFEQTCLPLRYNLHTDTIL
ncbi:MAG TPA: hypothetical protein PKH93_12000 [Chitinophagales bacterium]|nr:hypothetical protein [Chitinophagales bacterium]HNL08287.1 hypothetical protein [Chitinophagales bacterium]